MTTNSHSSSKEPRDEEMPEVLVAFVRLQADLGGGPTVGPIALSRDKRHVLRSCASLGERPGPGFVV